LLLTARSFLIASVSVSVGLVLFSIDTTAAAEGPDAEELVWAAFDHMRGETSIATVSMTIHRPDWERTMRIRAYTKGDDESIFWILSPPKDHGNGTLKKGTDMWLYNPKINRTIRIPPSMMSQAWMGSDFSNNDLAKSTSLKTDYTHTLSRPVSVDGRKAYEVTSIPKPDAPIVWGMQKLVIREDNVLLREEFYDQEKKLVKALRCSDIALLGGRLFPKTWIMKKAGARDEYTQITYSELIFDKELPGNLFTVSALKNPRK
jgi:outer membrane lipoprotein-sorting protein